MARHVFPGYRPFLESAAHDAGVAIEVIDKARHLKPLDVVSTLLGQAVEHPIAATGQAIVAEAEKAHAVLAVATAASLAMIEDVRVGLGLEPSQSTPAQQAERDELAARIAQLESDLATEKARADAAEAKLAVSAKPKA